MSEYKLPIRTELVILSTNVINAKELHIEVLLQQHNGKWQLPGTWLKPEMSCEDCIKNITESFNTSGSEFVGCFSEVERSTKDDHRYLNFVHRLLVAKQAVKLSSNDDYQWVDIQLSQGMLNSETDSKLIYDILESIKEKRGVAFLEDVIAMLPTQFGTRDARNLCELLKGKAQEFAIFQRYLEKNEKIRLVKLAEKPTGKGRPAKIYEKT